MLKSKEIFAECVKKWGVDSQVAMCIEEMAELTQALCKMKRHNYTWTSTDSDGRWANLAEEVADVELMLDQVKYMFEIYRTDYRKRKKLAKLQELLKERSKPIYHG